jgi:hypothetical protein
MRNASALRSVAAGLGGSTSHRTVQCRGSTRLMSIVAALLATCALAGCGSEIADQRLASLKPKLERQRPPNCEYRTARLDKAGARQTDGQPTAADAEQRAKLDYERQCYRHAEIIARNRLRSLQDAVEVRVKPVKRTEGKPAEVDTPPQTP